MWRDIASALRTYRSALLTAFDTTGFPFSIRCTPVCDQANHRLWITLPADTAILPGKASLLMHSHDEQLWNYREFLIRGTLIKEDGRWSFTPTSACGGPAMHGTLNCIRQLRAMRATAARYLKHRGLPRPSVPWDDIQRLHREAAERGNTSK
jgi:hypothetical protein